MSWGLIHILLEQLRLTEYLNLVDGCEVVKADYVWSEAIYIQSDGSITPTSAPISKMDNVTYTLTNNIVDVAPTEEKERTHAALRFGDNRVQKLHKL